MKTPTKTESQRTSGKKRSQKTRSLRVQSLLSESGSPRYVIFTFVPLHRYLESSKTLKNRVDSKSNRTCLHEYEEKPFFLRTFHSLVFLFFCLVVSPGGTHLGNIKSLRSLDFYEVTLLLLITVLLKRTGGKTLCQRVLLLPWSTDPGRRGHQ